MSDIVPDSATNRLAFFTAIKTKLHEADNPLGFTPAELTSADALFVPLIAAYQKVVDTESAARRASGDAAEFWAENGTDLRSFIDALKSRPQFTEGLGDELHLFSTGSPRQPAEIKPRLTADPHRGGITLDGSKDYAETVNIYMRRAGETEWKQIAIKRKRLPFEDQHPPLKPGIPEVREYMARGVIGDDEVGQESDIVTATFTP
jgi:hypothetical protein